MTVRIDCKVEKISLKAILEDAEDFCQQFRTGALHDFSGLKKIIAKINEED